MSEPEVLVEKRGCAGFLTLNRPKALNALNLGMVRAIAAALDEWERDPAVTRVVVTGAGGRAFCAGGDIRLLYEQGRAGDHAAQLAFWREEYQLNRRIKRYSKPYIALVDGIVMGGGVGVSAHGAHLVAGEGFTFAMPEVGIGFFPDVGATYLLPRLPHRAGVYLAMTGARAHAGDALALGLADPLSQRAHGGACRGSEESVPLEAILPNSLCRRRLAAAGRRRALIEDCFAHTTPARIIAALGQAARAGSDFAQASPGGDARQIADQPGDRASANGGWPLLSFEEAMVRSFASSRGSVAAMTFMKACAP